MRGLRAARLTVLLCAFAVTDPAVALADPDDVKVAFCLSSTQRPALEETARVLDLQPEGDLAAWRRNKAEEFARACEALYGAQKAPQPSWFANVLPFLTGAAGALLAFVAAAWWDRVNRGRVLADALRVAVKEFHEVAEPYLRKWTPGQPDDEFVTNRRRLVHQLAVVASERRKWRKPPSLVDQLTTGQFGHGMTTGWGSNTEETRTERKNCVDGLVALRGDALTVAAALTSPVLGRWRAR